MSSWLDFNCVSYDKRIEYKPMGHPNHKCKPSNRDTIMQRGREFETVGRRFHSKLIDAAIIRGEYELTDR